MSDRRLRVAVALLAAMGAAIAAYLLYHRVAGGTIACATGGCGQVQDSEYAEIAGVPVALLGLLAYGALFATALSGHELARAAGAAIALGGLAFSVYLVYVQIALIDAVCQWCIASDVVMGALAAATVLRLANIVPARPRPFDAKIRRS
jgi:uncharacterized membrane protein